ncbi:MAG: hypothetical protein ACREJC_12280, partial [Tepidisphaeraceae bacterium]
ALHAGSIPVSAKTGRGLDQLFSSLIARVRGEQVRVVLETDVTAGKLLSFIEAHTLVNDRQFADGRVQIHADMSKQILSDLSRNRMVEVKNVHPLG